MPFIDQYNWKEINFPSHKKDWKRFGWNNKSFALILFMPYKSKEIRYAYKSKHNLNQEKQTNSFNNSMVKNGIILP